TPTQQSPRLGDPTVALHLSGFLPVILDIGLIGLERDENIVCCRHVNWRHSSAPFTEKAWSVTVIGDIGLPTDIGRSCLRLPLCDAIPHATPIAAATIRMRLCCHRVHLRPRLAAKVHRAMASACGSVPRIRSLSLTPLDERCSRAFLSLEHSPSAGVSRPKR